MERVSDISVKYRHMWVELVKKYSEVKSEVLDAIDYLKTGAKFVDSKSFLSNFLKKKNTIPQFNLKTYEPNSHVYTRILELPKDRELFNNLKNNIPEGYNILEARDKAGYAIEDIDNYVGVIKVIYYNEVYVEVVGTYNEETLEYDYNRFGNVTDFVYYESNSKLGR